jgi:hypothetical protein
MFDMRSLLSFRSASALASSSTGPSCNRLCDALTYPALLSMHYLIA